MSGPSLIRGFTIFGHVYTWRLNRVCGLQPEFYNKFQGREDLLAYAKERNIPIAMGAGNRPPYR